MSPIVLSLVLLAIPVVLCIYVGKWLLGACARAWCGRGSGEPQIAVSSLEDEEPLRFRYGGVRRLDRTTNSTWVFRDM